MGKSKTEFGLTNKKQFLRLAEARSVFGFRMGNKPKPTLQLAKVSLRRLGKKQIIGVSMSEAVNHESCPMTGSILSEKTDKSQDLNQPRIVSRELNFDFAQFFYPQEKRKIFKIRYFQSSITDKQGNTQNINAIVKPDATLGTLTTFDERVFYALIEIWQEQDKDDICRFSEREIARRINVQWGRQSAKAIRDSLTRLSGVSIEWKGSFYDSTKDELIEIHNPFSILNHLEITSTKNKHFKDKRAEFGFNQRVIKNLNSNYSRPVRFDVILSFHCPLAQALYTLTEPKLYGTKQYHRKTKGLVEDLGLIGKSYQRRAIRVQEFGKLQKELIGKPTSFGEVIESYEITLGKDDAVMVMERSGAGCIKGKKVEVFKTPQAKRSEPSQKLPQKPHQKAKESEAKETPTPAQEKPTRAKSEALEVLSYFQQVFCGGGKRSFSGKVVSKAESIIKEHGLEKTKFLIDFASREAPKTNYEPRSFNGIVHYLEDALKAWQGNKRLVKRQKKEADKVEKARIENARIDHERACQDDYIKFISELLNSYGSQDPERINEFGCWQVEKRNEQEQQLKGKLKERCLRIFDSDGQTALRLVQFFKDDPEIHFPDFWEWDSNHNPNPFSGSEAVV